MDWINWVQGVDLLYLKKVEDERGWLLKVAMLKHVGEEGKLFGEIYLSAIKPGKFKGGHYHSVMHEWFIVIKGSGKLLARRYPESWKPLEVLEESPVLIHVAPGISHAFYNYGTGETIILAYSNLPFNPESPDTFPDLPKDGETSEI